MAKEKGLDRRWQYGLGSFLVMTGLIGAGIGWWPRDRALSAEESAALVKLHRCYPRLKSLWGHITELALYRDPDQPRPLMRIDGELVHRTRRAPFHDDDLVPLKALLRLEV